MKHTAEELKKMGEDLTASLIKAAPDLYEATAELLDALYEASGCALKPKHEAVQARALTALKKARGEV